MKRIGQLVFSCAVVAALALYWVTAPEGLPWNRSTHLALAYLGEIVRLPSMSHPVWGCYVQVFGGAVPLSVVLAALAAGLLAVLVNRYFGWRFAVSAALVWIFLPGVWNRAITGERGICLAAMAILAAWAVDGVARRVLRKIRKAWIARNPASATAGGDVLGAPTVHDAAVKRGKVNRIAGWAAMGAAALFAVVSLTLHDYRYGEAASAFARGVVEAAGERVIVMNGVCDDQIVREIGARCRAEGKSDSAGQLGAAGVRALPRRNESDTKRHVHSTPTPILYTLSLRSDDAYRTNLLSWVRSAFPTETNLWAAARVGAAAFVEAAVKAHPERFYLMTGRDTTPERWEKRWEAFKPYLESSDPFVPVARRMFGYEGNAVANVICDGVAGVEKRCREEGKVCSAGRRGKDEAVHSTPNTYTSSAALAWQMYRRIYTEIDPGNISALVNMSEMIRHGHAASGDEKKWLREALEKFFKDAFNRQHAREIVRAAGPIRADPVVLERMAAEAKKRIAAKIAAGEKVEYSPEFLSLVEWNNEMVRLMAKGELVQAGRIARAILSNPKWRGFVPANAVMGSVAAREGDYVSSAAFFKVAADATNAVPAAALNDYADALLRLGRTDEAERQARRAVKASDESFWVARLTLAEVLERREKVKGRGQGRKVDEAALAAFAVGRQADARSTKEQDHRSSTSTLDVDSSPDAEIGDLLKSVLSHAPAAVCDQIRKEHRGHVR